MREEDMKAASGFQHLSPWTFSPRNSWICLSSMDPQSSHLHPLSPRFLGLSIPGLHFGQLSRPMAAMAGF